MSILDFQCRHRFLSGFEIEVRFRTRQPVTLLFGPSGSGKTSILEMIAGTLRPREGRIEVNGRVLLDSSRNVFLPAQKRHIAAVFQDLLLFPHYRVEGNLRYGQKRRSQRSGIEFERVVAVLELEALLGRYPSRLSGGEKQRVALGRALLSGPDLLLMDEPVAGLEESLRTRILNYVERVVEEWQIPAILVSHARQEARSRVDWVVMIEQGRVIREGFPSELFQDELEP